MEQSAASPSLSPDSLRRKPQFVRRMLRLARKQPIGAISLILLAVLAFVAAAGPFISPHDPYQSVGEHLQSPSTEHWMGTDQLGRDLLSRIIVGARISLLVGTVSVLMGSITGTVIGLVSGYFGGYVDALLQRLMDAILAFPTLVLALAMVAVLGPSTTNVMFAIALILVPGTSRVVRGAVFAVKEEPYVLSARAIGCGSSRIVLRHILPNVMVPVIILASGSIGLAILVEAALSFLGLGAAPDEPSWGRMLSSDARRFMYQAPWMAIFPGIVLSLTVMSFNLLGDSIRDTVDPRLRSR